MRIIRKDHLYFRQASKDSGLEGIPLYNIYVWSSSSKDPGLLIVKKAPLACLKKKKKYPLNYYFKILPLLAKSKFKHIPTGVILWEFKMLGLP